MSQPSLTNNDPYAYVDTVYERPARNLASSSHNQSEHAEDLRFMVKEGGLFEPTWRRDMARTTQPLSDLDAGIRKKRKGRGAKEPTDGREEEEDIEALAAQLWHLIQAGLQARWDDQELHGGFVKRTPIEILESLRPLRLRGYQRHAVNRILAALLRGARGFLLAYGMGLGKTIITIVIIIVLLKDRAHFGMDWLSHPTFEFRPELDVQGRYLLVVPKDLIMQWRTELRTRVNSDLKIVIYHPGPEEGHSINRSPSELAKADVVITTYETLRSDFEEMSQSEESFTRSHGKQWLGHHPLLVVYWLGVFFDEGHKLFNANTGMSQAAQALRSLFKIPITGTPLQNEYLECNTIMSLLQIEPFCSDSSAFRKYFLLPPEARSTAYPTLSGTLNAVLHLVFRSFTLRLNKHSIFDGEMLLRQLPQGRFSQITHDLTAEEQKPQDLVERQWSEAIRQALRANPHDESVPTSIIPSKEILKFVLMARLGVVHLACMDAGYGEAGDKDLALEDPLEIQTDASFTNESPIALSNHRRRTLKQKREAFMSTMEGGNWNSSRIRATLDRITEHRLRYPGKILVFSDFLCTLDVLAVALRENGMDVLRFDGTVNSKDREIVVQRFENDDDDARVLLVTSRSGGLGRSFTPADKVIHLTPCWNPAMTDQMTDRAIRFPQQRVVHVDHMYAPSSIETRVLELQGVKQGKAKNLLDPDDYMQGKIEEVRRWRKRDLILLLEVARAQAIQYAETEAKRLRRHREEKDRRRCPL